MCSSARGRELQEKGIEKGERGMEERKVVKCGEEKRGNNRGQKVRDKGKRDGERGKGKEVAEG